MERYFVLGEAAVDGLIAIRRVSDNRVSRCKPAWLNPDTSAGAPANAMVARSETKAIRLDGLEWKEEE